MKPNVLEHLVADAENVTAMVGREQQIVLRKRGENRVALYNLVLIVHAPVTGAPRRAGCHPKSKAFAVSSPRLCVEQILRRHRNRHEPVAGQREDRIDETEVGQVIIGAAVAITIDSDISGVVADEVRRIDVSVAVVSGGNS